MGKQKHDSGRKKQDLRTKEKKSKARDRKESKGGKDRKRQRNQGDYLAYVRRDVSAEHK